MVLRLVIRREIMSGSGRVCPRGRDIMGPEMLQSQFAALEEPENVLELVLFMSVKDLIDTIVAKYFS